jgi:hypothetical protein
MVAQRLRPPARPLRAEPAKAGTDEAAIDSMVVRIVRASTVSVATSIAAMPCSAKRRSLGADSRSRS